MLERLGREKESRKRCDRSIASLKIKGLLSTSLFGDRTKKITKTRKLREKISWQKAAQATQAS